MPGRLGRAFGADEWPQWRGPNRDGVWSETGILDEFPSSQIDLRWRVPISSGYSGPTVAGGRVYVSDRVDEPEEVERVHCFDWASGEKLWTYGYDCRYAKVGYVAGPRAAGGDRRRPSLCAGHNGAFALSPRRHGKAALEQDTRQRVRRPFADLGISTAPLVEAEVVIVQMGAADGACIVALDKKTGAEKWRALDDRASYSAPNRHPTGRPARARERRGGWAVADSTSTTMKTTRRTFVAMNVTRSACCST